MIFKTTHMSSASCLYDAQGTLVCDGQQAAAPATSAPAAPMQDDSLLETFWQKEGLPTMQKLNAKASPSDNSGTSQREFFFGAANSLLDNHHPLADLARAQQKGGREMFCNGTCGLGF